MERYRKIKQIGTGSFGNAWLVESAVSGRKYALKELGVSIMSEQDRQLALNEAKILSQLKHKSIVRYKEAFVAEGKLCIAMEFAEKGDLYSRIKQRNGVHFPETQILDWFTQLCFALKYIHGQNILHRDLKTQNIFLSKDDVIKLGDFGIARMLNSTLDHAQTTVGTPYYLSPEICQRKPYNHKSDMWSLGCVLYEMTTLQHAFNADNFSALVIKILQGQYPPIPPFYGPLLKDLVSVLLRRNAEERPSAKQLLHVPAMQLYVGKFLLCEINRTDSVASISCDVSTRSVQAERSQISGPTNVLTNRGNCKETNSDVKSAVALDPEKRRKEDGSERKRSCTIERRRSSDHRTGSKELQFHGNIPYNPLSQSGKHSLEHARKCRNSSVPVSRAMQKKIHNSGAQSRLCSEVEDDVFAENQPTVIPMKRQESSCALVVNSSKGTAKNCKVSSVSKKQGNESSSAYQSKDAGEVRVRRRHQSVLTVFNRSCWQTEQNQRRLTSRSILGSKNQENANVMNVLRNVVSQQRTLSSAMKQTHFSTAKKQPTSKPSTLDTGSEHEVRKRTYTVSHGRRPSEFEIPDVDKGRQQKERKTADTTYYSERVRSTSDHSFCVMKNSKPSSSDKNLPPHKNRNGLRERKEADNVEMEKRESLRACPHSSFKIARTERKDNRILTPPCKFTFCGKTLVLDNVTNCDSAYSHMEALRMHLETILGTRLFTDVYRYITEKSCENYDELREKAVHILGEHNMAHYPVILQLVACEAFYFQ